MKTLTKFIYAAFALFALACFAISPTAQAVTPAPDGGYPGANTAEGDFSLNNLTSGLGNTALGYGALLLITTGNYNTATGAGALNLNTGIQNTATGYNALQANTTGNNSTAVGYIALSHNNGLGGNTAVGALALTNNTSGYENVATGFGALSSNTTAFGISLPESMHSVSILPARSTRLLAMRRWLAIQLAVSILHWAGAQVMALQRAITILISAIRALLVNRARFVWAISHNKPMPISLAFKV